MIEIQNLSKKYGKLTVLNKLSLKMDAGECIALIGPNGSGKTTLIKTILGMVLPQSGNILFEGINIQGQWTYRNEIGYMPQIGIYPDNMSIGQVFNMMKGIRKSSRKTLDYELYEAFGMPRLLDKKMSTLSGGTRQKVSACLAFMFNPKVLILDEPTAGLDPLSTEILKDKIKKEIKSNKLILISSHVLSDLDEIVSEVIYLQEGKLVFQKSMEQLKHDTATDKLSKAIAQVMTDQSIQKVEL